MTARCFVREPQPGPIATNGIHRAQGFIIFPGQDVQAVGLAGNTRHRTATRDGKVTQLPPIGQIESMDAKIDTKGFENARKLKELRVEHSDLDYVISHLSNDPNVDQLRIRRLKKRKLMLKDMIARIESELIPDLNA